MKKNSYLRICLDVCTINASIFAWVHVSLITLKVLKLPACCISSTQSTSKVLRRIWYARVARRMLSLIMRTPLRKNFLSLINCTIPIPTDSGCVIVVCHSPWKRVLVQWCLENKFGLIIGGGKWFRQKKTIQRAGSGFSDLRSIIRYLKQKGRVILAADFFNTLMDCPVNFLGTEYNASIVHIRLALMAEVPIVAVIPRLNNSSIDFLIGPTMEPESLRGNLNKTVERILMFFEREIASDPSLWSPYAN